MFNFRKVKHRKVFWRALDTYITATVNIIVLLKLDKKNFLGDVFVSKSTNTTLLVSCLRTASVCRLRLRKHHILYIKAYVYICRRALQNSITSEDTMCYYQNSYHFFWLLKINILLIYQQNHSLIWNLQQILIQFHFKFVILIEYIIIFYWY